MPSCTECGQPTLFDGVCTQCSDKRFDEYPNLKSKVSSLNAEIQSLKYDRVDLINRCKNESKQKAQLTKLETILNIDTVGWASPKVLIDTIRREVFGLS